MGCDGWGYADVLPYFKKMECYSGGGMILEVVRSIKGT